MQFSEKLSTPPEIPFRHVQGLSRSRDEREHKPHDSYDNYPPRAPPTSRKAEKLRVEKSPSTPPRRVRTTSSKPAAPDPPPIPYKAPPNRDGTPHECGLGFEAKQPWWARE
ncbi:hypothetical protein ACMFMF_003233 [Clarireedia jacksonii]